MKGLKKITGAVCKTSGSSHLSAKFVVSNPHGFDLTHSQKDWIQKAKLFEILYAPESHTQLIQKTDKLLEYLIKNNLFTKQNLEVLW